MDTKAKSIQTEKGETILYNTLVIATGGYVRKLSDPGANLKNIYYLREVTQYFIVVICSSYLMYTL